MELLFFFFKRLLKEFDKMPKLGTQKKTNKQTKFREKWRVGNNFLFFLLFFVAASPDWADRSAAVEEENAATDAKKS